MVSAVGIAGFDTHVASDVQIDVTQIRLGGRWVTGVARVHAPANNVVGQTEAQCHGGRPVAARDRHGYPGRHDLGIDVGQIQHLDGNITRGGTGRSVTADRSLVNICLSGTLQFVQRQRTAAADGNTRAPAGQADRHTRRRGQGRNAGIAGCFDNQIAVTRTPQADVGI